MNRRSLLKLMGTIPFIGYFVKPLESKTPKFPHESVDGYTIQEMSGREYLGKIPHDSEFIYTNCIQNEHHTIKYHINIWSKNKYIFTVSKIQSIETIRDSINTERINIENKWKGFFHKKYIEDIIDLCNALHDHKYLFPDKTKALKSNPPTDMSEYEKFWFKLAYFDFPPYMADPFSKPEEIIYTVKFQDKVELTLKEIVYSAENEYKLNTKRGFLTVLKPEI